MSTNRLCLGHLQHNNYMYYSLKDKNYTELCLKSQFVPRSKHSSVGVERRSLHV
jgi:hypothetical protein